MSNAPITGFGGFDPAQLGSTRPAAISYDPAAGHPVDREHPAQHYEEAEQKAPSGAAVDRRVPFELLPK